MDAKTIKRSQLRLEQLGWITRPRRKGRSNALSLVYDNLPGDEPLRLKLTPASGRITVSFMDELRRRGRRRFPAYWLAQQRPSAQRILDRCNGDEAHALSVITHAVTDPRHRAKSTKGLYNILLRWAKVTSTHTPSPPSLTHSTVTEEVLSPDEHALLDGLGLSLGADGELVVKATGRKASETAGQRALEAIQTCRLKHSTE